MNFTTLEEAQEWIGQQPDPNDVTDSPEGGKQIPIDRLKPLLSELDPSWGTENFKWNYITLEDGVYCNGSVELVLSYGGIKRRLTGAATFNIETYARDSTPNTHFVAIMLANCTKNAALNVGRRFGSEINLIGDTYTSVTKVKRGVKEAVLIIPDKLIREKYAKAMVSKDHETIKRLESMYDFKIG